MPFLHRSAHAHSEQLERLLHLQLHPPAQAFNKACPIRPSYTLLPSRTHAVPIFLAHAFRKPQRSSFRALSWLGRRDSHPACYQALVHALTAPISAAHAPAPLAQREGRPGQPMPPFHPEGPAPKSSQRTARENRPHNGSPATTTLHLPPVHPASRRSGEVVPVVCFARETPHGDRGRKPGWWWFVVKELVLSGLS